MKRVGNRNKDTVNASQKKNEEERVTWGKVKGWTIGMSLDKGVFAGRK